MSPQIPDQSLLVATPCGRAAVMYLTAAGYGACGQAVAAVIGAARLVVAASGLAVFLKDQRLGRFMPMANRPRQLSLVDSSKHPQRHVVFPVTLAVRIPFAVVALDQDSCTAMDAVDPASELRSVDLELSSASYGQAVADSCMLARGDQVVPALGVAEDVAGKGLEAQLSTA